MELIIGRDWNDMSVEGRTRKDTLVWSVFHPTEKDLSNWYVKVLDPGGQVSPQMPFSEERFRAMLRVQKTDEAELTQGSAEAWISGFLSTHCKLTIERTERYVAFSTVSKRH